MAAEAAARGWVLWGMRRHSFCNAAAASGHDRGQEMRVQDLVPTNTMVGLHGGG